MKKSKQLNEVLAINYNYDLVNHAETPEDLYNAIREIAVDGIIQGKSRQFDAEKMVSQAAKFFSGEAPPNVVTRMYGLRQQAMYIKYYMDQKRLA